MKHLRAVNLMRINGNYDIEDVADINQLLIFDNFKLSLNYLTVVHK
jgi:hypothetical protein